VRIAAQYSFNHGLEEVQRQYRAKLDEVRRAIESIDANQHRTKRSREKTMRGKMLYSPRSLNQAFKEALHPSGWAHVRVPCEYSVVHYEQSYKVRRSNKGAFREMDFVKDGLGVEVQFGKYSFMVYNVCAKMTIFRNLGHIKMGIEIVPVKAFAEEMSTGVSYFEQFVWDLEQRGVANIDVPVMIIGIDAD
jgi:Restriction endonuclease BglII